MSDLQRVVIKAGGSLLSSEGGIERLVAWLRSEEATGLAPVRVLVVGGGAIADGVRKIDQANPLSDEAAHWAAIRALEINTHLVAEQLTGFLQTDQLQSIRSCNEQRDFLLQPMRFLLDEEPSLPGAPLTIGWDVTSDSIAARVAACLGSSLVLIKSAPGCVASSWPDASAAGLVDRAFPRYAEEVDSIRVLYLPGHPDGGAGGDRPGKAKILPTKR